MAAIDNAGGQATDLGGGGSDLARRLIAALMSVRAKATPWEWATYGALLVVGGAMRLWDLGSRAVHHDESLHAYYAWKLASGDGYAHDPLMHGPLQFELNAAIFLLFGDSDYTSRLLYAIAGSALILMPLLFRKRLGTLGAIFTAAMLAFSPAMLYFSRFARNDILMAVWVLGLVICLWRYIDEGKARYLHIAAGLLALAFATKESAYLITGLLGLYLICLLLARNAGAITASAGVRVGETRTAAAIGQIAGAFWRGATDFKGKRGPAAFSAAAHHADPAPVVGGHRDVPGHALAELVEPDIRERRTRRGRDRLAERRRGAYRVLVRADAARGRGRLSG